MRDKVIVIVEDDKEEREILHSFLAMQGFQTESAASFDEAWRLIEELGEDIDLLILDVIIEDSEGSAMNGLEFGLKVKDRLKDWPPEFLINTAYGEAVFYQLALQLGAATYFIKPSNLSELLRLVRALTLRRALVPWRPEVMATIHQLARQSHGPAEAGSLICQTLFHDELRATLDMPFLLLVGDHEGVTNFGSGLDLPARSLAYEWLQQLSQLHVPSDPLVVDPAFAPDGPPSPERDAALKLLGDLRGAAFIPLVSRDGLRVSLGVAQMEGESSRFWEDATELCRVIGARVQPSLLRFLIDLTETWTRAYAKQRVLEAAAEFCLFVGQEQVDLLDRALSSGAFAEGVLPVEMQRLAILGENLRNAGEMLSWISRPQGAEKDASAGETPSMAKVVRGAWEDLTGALDGIGPHLLRIEGDCLVMGRGDDLHIAVAGILRWLAQRLLETPPGLPPGVLVRCRSTADGARIDFSDHSRRLPRHLRERIFSLFSGPVAEDPGQPGRHRELLGLYLSKVLIEKQDGSLEDCSDSSDEGVGHRFVVHLPQPQGLSSGLSLH